MKVLTLSTYSYNIDIARLIKRRLAANAPTETVCALNTNETQIFIESTAMFHAFCHALALTLLYDIVYFELADIIDRLPLTLAEKQSVLPAACKRINSISALEKTESALLAYFCDNDSLVLEGFVMFRMQDEKRAWELCAAECAEELVLEREFLELMGLLSALVKSQPVRIRELNIILSPDGTCTLTDESDTRIKCESKRYDNIINLLISLSPGRITIYDLSLNKSTLLVEAIQRVFENRVSLRK